jgi:DUF1680 family protein
MKKITLTDNFLAPRQKLCIDVTIPAALKRCEETGRLDAFKRQWTPDCGEECPHIYWDSDVAKVMEGMAYASAMSDNEQIKRRLDELVELVLSAQEPDGYLNTHHAVCKDKPRWHDLFDGHELYCAGHLIEAAVARYHALGKSDFLAAMCRYADCIWREFGPEGSNKGCPGHEELELALVKLFHATGERRYLELAKLFIDRRGTEPNYFLSENVKYAKYRNLENRQAHKPVREQEKPVGHSVRAMYLFCGMADVARETNDDELLNACKRLFADLVSTKMYLTGGIGSRYIGETIGHDFELPQGTAYAESCANIGVVLFASRMLAITGEAIYADVMETEICNAALSGLSLSGDKFFYANPQQCGADTAEIGHTYRERQPWHNTSCCPTSFCRFIPQLGTFCCRIFSPRQIVLDIMPSMRIETETCTIAITSEWPYGGNAKITIEKGNGIALKIRIPTWSKNFQITCEGEIANRYWTNKAPFNAGDSIEIDFGLASELVFTTPQIETCRGMAAIRRGPLVYCVESNDCDGFEPCQLSIASKPNFREVQAIDLPEGTVALRCNGYITERQPCSFTTAPPQLKPVEFVAIPYILWQNRKPGNMEIFLPVRNV